MTAAYPNLRLRRTRAWGWSRALHRETVLTPADLIQALAGVFASDQNGDSDPLVERDDGSWLISGWLAADTRGWIFAPAMASRSWR